MAMGLGIRWSSYYNYFNTINLLYLRFNGPRANRKS